MCTSLLDVLHLMVNCVMLCSTLPYPTLLYSALLDSGVVWCCLVLYCNTLPHIASRCISLIESRRIVSYIITCLDGVVCALLVAAMDVGAG